MRTNRIQRPGGPVATARGSPGDSGPELSRIPELQEMPQVAVEIFKHRHRAVAFLLGLPDEAHATRDIKSR